MRERMGGINRERDIDIEYQRYRERERDRNKEIQRERERKCKILLFKCWNRGKWRVNDPFAHFSNFFLHY